MKEIEVILDRVKELNYLSGKKTVFLIANTAKGESLDFYIIPIRNYNNIIVSGAVVFNEMMAKSIATKVDGLVDYIFVDAEKKILGNKNKTNVSDDIERSVKDVVKNSILISYKANDLTVDAADAFISEYFSNLPFRMARRRIAIIGVGNIGSKLALKLVERDIDVFLYRRDKNKLKLTVDFINNIKNKYTTASAYASDSSMNTCNNADVIIGATNGIPVINQDMIKRISGNSLAIDIGKGSISKGAIIESERRGIDIFRLSVESALEGLITSLISTNSIYSDRTGRGVYHGIKVASGGFIARTDELVVDNYQQPKYVYGVGNGFGDFDRNPNQESLDLIKCLEGIISGLG